MIFKSIRWRLQVWYGVLLIAVLAGFGITAYQLERKRQMEAIDTELEVRLQALAGSLESSHHLRPPPEEDFPDRPPESMPDGPPGQQMPKGFRLSPGAAALFGANTSGGYYYMVYLRDHTLLAASTNAPRDRSPIRSLKNEEFSVHWVDSGDTTKWYHDRVMTTPPGEVLLAGRYIAPEIAALNVLKLKLTGAGVFVLLLGLVGGGWLVTTAIRPIEDISSTAVKIAAGDLTQRINVEDTENELGRLAAVLNSTFARLEAAFAQQGQFTADAAHELRTPVTVILTQTQMALKRERDAAEYRATIEACERAAQRMRRLLESLLELTRLDAGQEPMQPRRFELSHTVADCIELLQPLASEREIKIHRELPPLESTGDAERLAQVFTNLLTNAIQYNHDRGEVRVTVQRQNDSAIVTVTNTGPGIAAEDLPRVFERFYRGDKSRTGTAARNGLGLSISKAIVEAHGGALEAASVPGQTTTFTVRLPLATS